MRKSKKLLYDNLNHYLFYNNLFYNIFLIILLLFSFIFQSKLKDAIASHSEELDKNSTPNDIFSQVFGKDRHGYVCTYRKGVVP